MGETSPIMGCDSTGGTSRGSGKSPVVSFSAFERWLAASGIDAGDGQLSRHLFRSVGAYRLRPYVTALSDARVPGRLRSVQVLCDVLAFDRDIRSEMLRAFDAIEIHLKAQCIAAFTEHLGEGGLEDPPNFKHLKDHKKVLSSLRREAARAGKSAARRAGRGGASVAAKGAAAPPAADAAALPDGGAAGCASEVEMPSADGRDTAQPAGGSPRLPTAAAIDAASLGTVSRLLGNMRCHEAVDAVASSFSANKRCLVSWLRALSLARNCFAHFAPYVVRRQAPSVPKPVYGVDCDNAAPLYILFVAGRLLEGMAAAAGPRERGDLLRYRGALGLVVGRFVWAHPELAGPLRIPYAYARGYADPLLPTVTLSRGRPSVHYCVLAA